MGVRSKGVLFAQRCGTGCAILWLGACATRVPSTAPETGTVTVGVTASGREIAGLVFEVEIPSTGAKGPVKADAGVFTARNVPGGAQIVKIGSLPDRCRVDGGPERTVTVSRERTATVRFVVTCSNPAAVVPLRHFRFPIQDAFFRILLNSAL
jgi:hypothetical protein